MHHDFTIQAFGTLKRNKTVIFKHRPSQITGGGHLHELSQPQGPPVSIVDTNRWRPAVTLIMSNRCFTSGWGVAWIHGGVAEWLRRSASNHERSTRVGSIPRRRNH